MLATLPSSFVCTMNICKHSTVRALTSQSMLAISEKEQSNNNAWIRSFDSLVVNDSRSEESSGHPNFALHWSRGPEPIETQFDDVTDLEG
ncbi:hypothetical protein J6590_048285 [Homalodisca vitripennis]|nr:hypothetical protein J6590_048285 [Homalodisca vitripennis]